LLKGGIGRSLSQRDVRERIRILEAG